MSSELPDLNSHTAGIAGSLQDLARHDAETIRGLRREISVAISEYPPRDAIRLAIKVMESGAPGCHLIACELILYHPSALASVRPPDLERLGTGMSGWGDVDTFACLVAGRAWRVGQIPDTVVASWARSDNRWWRRAALVSTVPLNVKAQGGTGDAKRTLAVCRLLLEDRDPMVVKALSWALRALAVREPAAVTRFMKRHGERIAPRVVREVQSKLSTGRKDSKRGRRKPV